MLETAHSEVASRFPRNCSLSQPVSKAWKLPKKSLRRLRRTPRSQKRGRKVGGGENHHWIVENHSKVKLRHVEGGKRADAGSRDAAGAAVELSDSD